MKMNKKKVFVIALAICLIAILSFSTLAWFTDNEEVENKFHIATSDDDTADEIFSVDVWEETPDGRVDETGATYKDVLPGDVLTKQVNVVNTGYYDQYIRVTVTVSDATAWMAVLNTTSIPALGDIVTDFDENVWPCARTRDTLNDTLVYTLYYNGTLDGSDDNDNGASVVVFENVKIPSTMTAEQAAAFKSEFAITVKAEAIQTENVGVDSTNNILDAIEAFDYVQANS